MLHPHMIIANRGLIGRHAPFAGNGVVWIGNCRYYFLEIGVARVGIQFNFDSKTYLGNMPDAVPSYDEIQDTIGRV